MMDSDNLLSNYMLQQLLFKNRSCQLQKPATHTHNKYSKVNAEEETWNREMEALLELKASIHHPLPLKTTYYVGCILCIAVWLT
jgi:hypothetical protein